jgi:ATP sulfurylase
MAEREIPKGFKGKRVSGTEVRDRLAKGEGLPPPWLSFPEVTSELKKRLNHVICRGSPSFLPVYHTRRKVKSS